MPESVISSLFTRSSSKNSVSKEYKCTVQLLDDSESITVEFKKNESGQSVIDYVCDYLQIVEKDYFGLRFLDSSKHRYWLDPTKPVLKQVKTEQGDYDPEINKEGYVSEFKLFLKQTAKVEEKVEDIHKSLSGQTPAQAEENFVRKAAKLDTYGFDPYNVKDTKAGQVYLGATHLGIIVYQSNKKLHHITWDELEKVDYLGKDFYVYPKPEYIMDGASANQTLPQLNGTKEEENEIDASILGSRNSSKANLSLDSHATQKRNAVLRFQCPSAHFCKHLWKHTLAQRAFFTESDGSHCKILHSKRRIPVISRGSTFRYAGRVLNEIKEDEAPVREEPSFVRYHADRQPSRLERSFPWGSFHSKSAKICGSYTSMFLGTSESDLEIITTLKEMQLESARKLSQNSTHPNHLCFPKPGKKKEKHKERIEKSFEENKTEDFVYVPNLKPKMHKMDPEQPKLDPAGTKFEEERPKFNLESPKFASEEGLTLSEYSSHNNLCFDCSGKLGKRKLGNRRNKMPLKKQESLKKVEFCKQDPVEIEDTTDFLDAEKLSIYDNLEYVDSNSLNKEKPESNGAVTGELQKEGKTLLLDATDGVSPLHSPAELSPDSIIASSDLDTSLYRGETGSPLSNSTPLKIQPVKISDTNELKSRYAPMGDKLDKTTISVSLSSKESTNQAGSTGDAVAKGENDTSATGGGGEKRGVCCRLIGHLLTGLLLGIILITIVVAVFEVKDSQFRGYVHAIPGLEHFRHTFYEPGRGYVMDQYGYVLGKNKRFWFAP